jgi:hypothetical protein
MSTCLKVVDTRRWGLPYAHISGAIEKIPYRQVNIYFQNWQLFFSKDTDYTFEN